MSSKETNASELKRGGEEQNAFGKKQIMGSVVYTPKEKDVLEVVLQESGSYTLEEVKQLMELYLNKEVI
ncbi:hypothetical protein P40081_33840 [Paenibacillus sp. FSL P4-0081]|jgi:hypothetical protein|uniref:hypothetical protein n=1 Tax=unclassified Paenibacillus TaxID=185978 RepID=UPI0004F5EA69|nr:hypothetical protein [Paenibacillus sp. FSL P4-0081]AIQ32532.1 hypothetical protein P40081_33840 [Paenibacillus sp. FSL P4-0081]